MKTVVLGVLMSGAIALPTQAQNLVVPDATLGNERSIVESRPGFDAIQGGATRGTGLFHSFSEFGVGDRAAVNFLVTPQIQNIFARVTGNSASSIQGSLGTRIDDAALSPSTASLFLLNPNGIVFGPNATLDLAGSFLATTASRIKFGDREFSAIDPQVPLLTVSVPTGLGFGQTVGDINIDGAQLSAGNGKTLAFIGGDVKVSNEAAVFMQSGNIHLGAIDKAETIGIQSVDGLWAIDYVGTGNFRNLVLEKSLVASVGDEMNPTADIFLNSKNLTLQNNASIVTVLKGEDSGGNIKIRATGDIVLRSFNTRDTAILTFNQSNGLARGGNINIEAASLTIADGASITTLTSKGRGKAGNIDINLRGLLAITGEYLFKEITPPPKETPNAAPKEKITLLPSRLASTFSSNEVGDAGNIVVFAHDILLDRGGHILLDNGGGINPGIVDLNIRNNAVFSGTTTRKFSSGIYNRQDDRNDRDEFISLNNIIGIRINAQSLLIDKGAIVSTLSIVDGNSKNIEINTSGDLTIRGEKRVTDKDGSEKFISSIIETRKNNGIGSSGRVTLRVDRLNILEGGLIDSGIAIVDFSKSDLDVPQTPIGTFQGQSGTIDIIARDAVTIDGYGSKELSALSPSEFYNISQINSGVNSSATGQGGVVSIQTRDLAVTNGGQILTGTGARGDAGNISISASGRVLVAGDSDSSNRDAYDVSRIASETRFAIQGDGGTISISANLIELQNGGALRTSNINSTGNAGSIVLNANNSINVSGQSQKGNASGIFSAVKTVSDSDRASIQKNIDSIETEKFILPAEAIGNSGTISISAPIFRLTDGGEVSAVNDAQGKAGSIAINLSDRLILNRLVAL
jgi:filamentous hemagglutinin family protein